ncbi:hypothetical protein BRD15_08830 [Halobacteriales archaeon SW_6_65_15]|nr:MAG: hypothetical protein BRD15_08830 [Halobacteriales archaeon SW_6_65_15]
MSSTRPQADEPEAKNPDACQVVEAIEQIGSQWRLVVLHDLLGEEKRFNELERSTGASSRTLSRVLDDLEAASNRGPTTGSTRPPPRPTTTDGERVAESGRPRGPNETAYGFGTRDFR